MCIVFVCMRYVKKFGCHYNQSGVLKIEILILLRLARFQNSGTPPNRAPTIMVLSNFREFQFSAPIFGRGATPAPGVCNFENTQNS